jgi:iron(III) transport system substrate-binding protein
MRVIGLSARRDAATVMLLALAGSLEMIRIQLAFLTGVVAAVILIGCSDDGEAPPKSGEVVVYSSVDEVFARPIAEEFEKETGIEVRLVPDTEETKSTGLLNRLIAEKQRPVADVFWSGDPVRAAILKSNGVSAPYRSPEAESLPERFSDPAHHWTGFSARARILIYNTELVPDDDQKPTSVMDLLDERFKGKVCIANPLFGTTSMHAAALFAVLGEDEAKRFFEGFIANGGRILSSNGEVRRRVAAGECALGITDTDDFNVARIEGKPVAAVYPDARGMGTLVIPNSAVLIADAPHADNAKEFIDYLLRAQTEELLAESEAAQMPVRSGVEIPDHVMPLEQLTPMEVDYDKLAPMLEELSRGYLKQWVDRNLR